MRNGRRGTRSPAAVISRARRHATRSAGISQRGPVGRGGRRRVASRASYIARNRAAVWAEVERRRVMGWRAEDAPPRPRGLARVHSGVTGTGDRRLTGSSGSVNRRSAERDYSTLPASARRPLLVVCGVREVGHGVPFVFRRRSRPESGAEAITSAALAARTRSHEERRRFGPSPGRTSSHARTASTYSMTTSWRSTTSLEFRA